MAAFEVLAVLVVLFTALYLYMTSTAGFWEKRGVPHLKPMPFVGNDKQFFLLNESRGVVMQRYYKYAKARGYKYFGLFVGRRPTLIATDMDFLKAVLVKDFNHFMDHGGSFNRKTEPLTAHLFNLRGDEWRSMRSKLSPTFTSGKMKGMFHLVRACADEFHGFLKEYAERNEEVEMTEALAKYTTDVIGTCAFGIEANSMKDPNAAFRVMGRKNFEVSAVRMLALMLGESLPALKSVMPISPLRRDVAAFFTRTFNDNFRYREQNNVVRHDFVGLLLQLKKEGQGIDEAILPAQAFVFFLAGFETSSGALSFCLTELAHHPEIQDKVRAEVEAVLAKHGQITYEALQEMTYMEQVIDETLRLYPALAVIPREVTEDYLLPGAKAVIEKGTRISIPVYAIHRDPEFYPDPDKFNPENFSPENKRNRPQYAFMPFGEGPRICIGLRFAMMQMKTALAMIMKNFDVCPSEGTIYPITINPKAFVTRMNGSAKLRLVLKNGTPVV